MADVTIASNASGAEGVWNKYYYKPFYLGACGTSGSGEDGNTYITQTTGTSAEAIRARCFSSYNCNFYYKLRFSGTDQNFYVIKYDKNTDTQVDRIYASVTTGAADGNWWKPTVTYSLTIDIGVSIWIPNGASFDALDEYKISLPDIQTMRNRRIYHGGFSGFVRMPETEGKSYHSTIIPVNLRDRNITMSFNQYMGDELNTGDPTGLFLAPSLEDVTGNKAISVFLEWSTNKDAANANVASDVATYGWGTGEKWQLGSIFVADVRPGQDTPVVSQSPQSDTTPSVASTGANQIINVTCAGRAGYAKIRTEYQDGTGSPAITAHNQFWPVTIMID